MVGRARGQQGRGELRHCGVCADGDVVLLLGHHGQTGPVAGTDCAGRLVPGGRMGVGGGAAQVGGEYWGGGGMNGDRMGRAVALLVVQAVLVLSIAGKYVYERKTCPRVWVRAAQYDPNMPLRGRYLALRLALDACGLPRDESHHMGAIPTAHSPDSGS